MDTSIAERQRWMSVLAKADEEALAERMGALGALPPYELLRPPEPGTVMVRARAGGTGTPFNLGEMTVTRCAVRLEGGTVGQSYVQGRGPRHAELAAVADALLQERARHAEVEATVVEPLAARARSLRELRERKAAATRVDFFTLVRGESG